MIYHLAEHSNIRRKGVVLNDLEKNQTPEDPTCQVPAHVLARVWDNTLPDSELREFFKAVVCHPDMKKDPKIFKVLRPDVSCDILKHYAQIHSRVSQILEDPRYETYLSGATARQVADIAGLFAPPSPTQFHVTK